MNKISRESEATGSLQLPSFIWTEGYAGIILCYLGFLVILKFLKGTITFYWSILPLIWTNISRSPNWP